MSRLAKILTTILAAATVPAFAGRMTISPSQFSPNGDGVRDEVKITLYSTPGDMATVKIYNSAGALVITIAENIQLDLDKTELSWNGSGGIGAVPNGTYIVKASFKGTESSQASAKIVVDNSHKWPPIKYTSRPYFPIGVLFDGNPERSKYSSDKSGARRYYDQCFAELRDRGFNTVAVSNCPENLWETLLESAQRNGIKVALEVAPLAKLVSSKSITESQVYYEAKRVYSKIGKYFSLVRYQLPEATSPALVDNWLLIQRILAAVDPTRPVLSRFSSVTALNTIAGSTKLSEAFFSTYQLESSSRTQNVGAFVSTLKEFHSAAKGNIIWPVLQAFASSNGARYPTPEELRAMTYLSLAKGAKGIFYFPYQSMPNHPKKIEGMVDSTGAPTPIYETASNIAGELKRLAGLIMSLKPTEPYPTSSLGAESGSFADPTGRPVLIVASTRTDSPTTASFKVGSDVPWRDELTGELLTPKELVLEVPLAPGGGRILVKQ